MIVQIRKFIHVNNFPNISSLNMYNFLLPYCQPNVELLLNINWKTTWKNLYFKYVNIHVRDIVFNFLHNIITKSRLFQIKRSDSSLCSLCNVVKDKIHVFVKYRKVKEVYVILKKYCSNYVN